MPFRLHPCPACARHVRASETACPFCGASIPEIALEPPRAPRTGPVTRATLLFASATAVAACGSTGLIESSGPDASNPSATDGAAANDSGTANRDASTVGADGEGPLPMYGPAVVDSGASDADSGATMVMYGPAVIDSGAD